MMKTGNEENIFDEGAFRLPLAKVANGYKTSVVATEKQLRQIAASLSLEKIDSFECHFEIQEVRREKVIAFGLLKAAFQQNCVLTNTPLEQKLESPFELIFLPETEEMKEPLSMTEQDSQEKDVFYYKGDFLPLGQVAFEQFVLDIPPYPRAENADPIKLSAEDVRLEVEKTSNPFAVLKNFPFKSK